MASSGYIWAHIIAINILIKTISPTPLYFSQMSLNVNSRNIRHLPCVSLRTGETGVCMFAFNCVKANGTHLGTCLDRFYFGSCCKLNDDAEVYPQDNTIDDLPSTTFRPTGKPIESNDIPDYSVKPKPEKVPEFSSTVLTRKPVISTPYTTTQMPVEFSTFQTVQDSHRPAGNIPTSSHTSTSSTQYQKVTTVTEATTRRTGTTPFVKPSISSSSVNDRNPPVTRFPPRNITTTTQPTTTRRTTTKIPTTHRISTTAPKISATTPKISSTTPKISATTPRISATTSRISATTPKISATTPKISTTVSRLTTTSRPSILTTRKPISTYTKKPTSPSRRPSTTPKPHTTSGGTSIQTTGTTNYSSTSVTKPTKPSLSGTTVTVVKKPILESSTTASISTNRFTTTPRPTSAKPLITSTPKPKPSLPTTETGTKPTKPATWTLGHVTEKPKPTIASVKPTSRPKPTGKPGKPAKPSKPTTVSTTTTTVLTSTSAPSSSSTVYTTRPSTQTVKTTTTSTTMKPVTSTTGVSSSVTPGFITWSSNSDDEMTRAPSTSSSSPSTTTQEPEEFIQTEWSPMTTPDGWVMIQSASTKKPGIQEEPITDPKPTKLSSSTVPSTQTSTTVHVPTTKPTLPTVVSSTSSSTHAILSTSTATPEEFTPLNMSDFKQVCGRRMLPESRIVGGESSSFGRWPWQISLRQWRTSAFLHKCGAALLNENWAITAAHCVENVPPSDLLLRMGEHDLANEDEPYGFQERRVQIVASHPQFDPRTFEYDLALLRFYEPLLPFQPNLLPICLPDDDEGYVGHTAFVTGWGRLYEDGPLPSVLQEVPVPVINNTMCEWMYKNAGYDERIPHIFICAGWRKGGFDSCEGDSGGPMVIQRPRDKRWILAGVISWGIGCAEPNQPGVYTRISEFREWINQILQF